MHLPFWTDLKMLISAVKIFFSKKQIEPLQEPYRYKLTFVTKRKYVKRSDYWLDVKGNRERIRKLREEVKTAPQPLSQAEIEYMARQAQSKIDKTDSWARNISGEAFGRRTKV